MGKKLSQVNLFSIILHSKVKIKLHQFTAMINLKSKAVSIL